jgi:hypothetical protein
VKEWETLARELTTGRAADDAARNVQLPLVEAKERAAAFMKEFGPLVREAAEARGLPPYLVATVLRAMADGFDAMPRRRR